MRMTNDDKPGHYIMTLRHLAFGTWHLPTDTREQPKGFAKAILSAIGKGSENKVTKNNINSHNRASSGSLSILVVKRDELIRLLSFSSSIGLAVVCQCCQLCVYRYDST